jgi:hypothetical protein
MADLEDKPGSLLRIMQDLKARNIGLAGLWGFGTREGKAKLYIVPVDPDELRDAWIAAGLLSGEGTGFFVTGEDRTGALNESLEALSNAGINIDAIDAVSVGSQFGSYIWVNASIVEKAASTLGAL